MWLVLGGRGAGKTRTGAEWVRAQALGIPPIAHQRAKRIALVGPTYQEARAVMVEGISGIMSISRRDLPSRRPVFLSSKREIVWPCGSVAQIFSAEDPEGLRGPQFEAAWVDELAKWRYMQETWDMLQFGLRQGTHPQVVVTTTPRRVPLLKALLNAPTTIISRASTFDNHLNLSASFLSRMEQTYGATSLGRQELMGELLEEDPNALFSRALIDRLRLPNPPRNLVRVVVAVDPPASSHEKSDSCGIVCAGIDQGGHAYVLDDHTLQGVSPSRWAGAAIALYHDRGADRLVAEINQGGDMVETIIRQQDDRVAFKPLRAVRGKRARAEPIAAFYERGRVHHCGMFPELEDEMALFSHAALGCGKSPDRLDALVWALTELLLAPTPPTPRVRTL